MCFLFIGLTPNRLTQREHWKVEHVFFVVAPLHFFILDNKVSYFEFLLFYAFSENFSTKQTRNRKTYHHLKKQQQISGLRRFAFDEAPTRSICPKCGYNLRPRAQGKDGSTATRAPSREAGQRSEVTK